MGTNRQEAIETVLWYFDLIAKSAGIDWTLDQNSELERAFSTLSATTAPAQNQVEVHHHRADDGPRVNVSVEKNSKGYNWSATVTGAANVQEAINLVADAEEGLKHQFGEA
jgi:hypothetical protein